MAQPRVPQVCWSLLDGPFLAPALKAELQAVTSITAHGSASTPTPSPTRGLSMGALGAAMGLLWGGNPALFGTWE